jgi:hypothetical protein
MKYLEEEGEKGKNIYIEKIKTRKRVVRRRRANKKEK